MKRLTADLGWCVAMLERKLGHLTDQHEEFTVDAYEKGGAVPQLWPTLLTIVQPEQEGTPASSIVVTTEGIINLYRMLNDMMPQDWYTRVWELEDRRRDAETIRQAPEPTAPTPLEIYNEALKQVGSGTLCPGFVDPQPQRVITDPVALAALDRAEPVAFVATPEGKIVGMTLPEERVSITLPTAAICGDDLAELQRRRSGDFDDDIPF
jgi:hypothetical protein